MQEATETPAPPSEVATTSAGELIVLALTKAGLLTEEQVLYARRVRSKLRSRKSIVQTLQELQLVTPRQVEDAVALGRVKAPLGDMLVELGHLSESGLEAALSMQKESASGGASRRLGQVLVDEHFVGQATLCRVLALQLGIAYREPDDALVARDVMPPRVARVCQEHHFVPLRLEEGGGLLVLFADPTSETDLERAASVFGRGFDVGVASLHAIDDTLERMERVRQQGPGRATDETSIVGIVQKLFEDAIQSGASDIHIEPMADNIRVRFRIDGVMIAVKTLPRSVAPGLATRLKVMAEADISERRRHQGGRIYYERPGTAEVVDLRVSFYVTIHGEKIVLRILSKKQQTHDINQIGMAPRMLERFRESALDFPSGVLIITGPTGSGKTTTLYSCLDYLNDISTSIITAEDPVEYIMDGVAQCSINAKIGLTFEETLRHIVRQDPDVVVLGEIRDTFSAQTAIQAALTGHKVLTTFHTEDSIGGLLRLLNMDIEAFLISSTVLCVVAQRLLRKVCPQCGEPYLPTPDDVRRSGLDASDLQTCNFRRGRGCRVCNFTGYKGRVGVFELLVLDESVKDAVLNRRTAYEIRRLSIENSGLVTLIEDGLVKAAAGETTLDEVIRVLPKLLAPRPLPELRRLLGYKV